MFIYIGLEKQNIIKEKNENKNTAYYNSDKNINNKQRK